MAAGEDGEHTRFPCLAMVRCAVATVVTVLAAAVVVVAIDLVLRPEDVRLSIDYGYIEADRLWLVTETRGADELPPFKSSVCSQVGMGPNRPACLGPGIRHGASAMYPATRWRPKRTTSTPADEVNLRVILSAHNPGGRSKIDCNKTTIRLIDMQNAYQEIVKFELENFTVPEHTAHTRTKQVVINDTNVLTYIWSQYHGETSFSVTVRVDAIITSYALGKETNINQTYFCWPVTVGLISVGSQRTNVACKTRLETQLPVESRPLPPSPAPAPAPMG